MPRAMRRTGPLEERITIPMKRRLARAIDDWRRQQDDLPGRAEAVRRLLEQALGISSDDDQEDGSPE